MQNNPVGNLDGLDGLAGLAGLADHSDLDIRPTLLRVLTDLYVQKPSHSVEEERHYVELALRLIEAVDAGTCAAVAASLSGYPAAPAEIVQRLAPISALKYPRPAIVARGEIARTEPAKVMPVQDDNEIDLFEPDSSEEPDIFEPEESEPDIFETDTPPATQTAPATAQVAASEPVSFVELRETFFAAEPEVRRLILMNLDAVAMPDMPALASGTNVMRYLEQAALARRRQEFTTLLQQSLGVSRALATRIVSDASGEPFAVAGRALAMPSDVFQRILMFLNPEIGQSVQQVYALADLFLDLPQDSALHLVAIWRAADRAEARAGFHRPLHWPDGGKSVRGDAAQERKVMSGPQSILGGAQRRA